MKPKQLLVVTAAATLCSATALAQSETNFLFNVNQAVPDNSAVGLTLGTDLTVLGGPIETVTVSLGISGGFNGDLYGYLDGPNGGFAVLLNRVGVSNNASQFGYSDSGFNVTFSDAAANSVQYYQNLSYTLNGSGQLTGLWQPEGVNIDPQSSPSSFLGAPQSALLGSFAGTDANGTWTLFLADLNAGGQSTVVSWGLDITTVPEPTTLALVGLAAGFLVIRRRTQAK